MTRLLATEPSNEIAPQVDTLAAPTIGAARLAIPIDTAATQTAAFATGQANFGSNNRSCDMLGLDNQEANRKFPMMVQLRSNRDTLMNIAVPYTPANSSVLTDQRQKAR